MAFAQQNNRIVKISPRKGKGIGGHHHYYQHQAAAKGKGRRSRRAIDIDVLCVTTALDSFGLLYYLRCHSSFSPGTPSAAAAATQLMSSL